MRKRQRALLGLIGALALWTAGFGAQDPSPAQDPASDPSHAEAVQFWNELQASVKDGTLTAAQAKQRLDEYRVSRGLPPATSKQQNQRNKQRRGQAKPQEQANQQANPQAGDRQPAQVKATFDAAVRKGRMSQEQADKRWERWQQAYARSNGGAGGSDAPTEAAPAGPKNAARESRAQAAAQNTPQLAKLREQLKAAVQRGDLTQDQAKKRLTAGLRQQKQSQGSDQELQQLMQRVQAAMGEGSLTSEETLRFLEPLKRHLDALQDTRAKQPQAGETQPRAGKAKGKRLDVPARIQALVDAGTISPLQGKARLEAYRRTEEDRQEQAAAPASGEPAERKTPEATELERQIEEVNNAVHESRLSREDGFAQIQELRKNAAMAKVEADQAARAEKALKSFQRRLDAGVKAGQLTAKQASQRLEAYRKRTER